MEISDCSQLVQSRGKNPDLQLASEVGGDRKWGEGEF